MLVECDMANDFIELSSVYPFSKSTNYYYAMISQNFIQKLPFPTTNKPNVHAIRRYHKHLHDGTKSDAVSGWLLYASFYYVLGKHLGLLVLVHEVSVLIVLHTTHQLSLPVSSSHSV
jgi:hypothetical protein